MASKDGYKRVVDNKLKSYGETDLKRKIIKINKSKNKRSEAKGELIDTIFHEEYHRRHPKAKEKTVIAKTTKALKSLSTKTKQKLYSKYAKK